MKVNFATGFRSQLALEMAKMTFMAPPYG